jgi:dienelactone hydrolase
VSGPNGSMDAGAEGSSPGTQPDGGSIACVPDAHGQPWTVTDATAAGPYTVASLNLSLVDTTRPSPAHGTYAGSNQRALPTSVWYPTMGSSTPAPSGFPIVLYSHGFLSSSSENTDLANHLASHGFVVVAPTFPETTLEAPGGPNADDVPNQAGDVSFVLDQVLALNGTTGNALAGLLDASRVAAVGLSAGGLTTLLVTFHETLRDARVRVAVAMAPPAGIFSQRFYETTRTPILVLHGTSDGVISYVPHAVTFKENALAPAALLSVEQGSHTGFSSESTLLTALGSTTVDSAPCAIIPNVVDPDSGLAHGDFSDYVGPLGGADAGVQPQAPGTFCPSPLPPEMDPTRQLQIVDEAVLSFLTAYLDSSQTVREQACQFVVETLPEASDLQFWHID